jgi:galactonate dehydratase
VWLKIHTDEGITGLGEPYLENHPESVIAEARRLEPLLIGEDPRRIEDLWRKMYDSGLGYKGGPVTMSAISGIDIALWDIASKVARLPIYQKRDGPALARLDREHSSKADAHLSEKHRSLPIRASPYRSNRPVSIVRLTYRHE